MKRQMAAMAAVLGAVLSASAAEYTVNRDAGDTEAMDPAEQAAILALGAEDTVVKTGAGTLSASGIASFAGTIRVENGVWKVTDNTGLGTLTAAAGEAVVASNETSGACGTIYIDYANPGTAFQNKRFRLSGHGYGGQGALRTANTAKITYGAMTLDGDASIVDDNTKSTETKAGTTWTMNGHTITIKTGEFGMKSTLADTGHFIIAKHKFGVYVDNSDSDVTVTFRDGGTTTFYNNRAKVLWKYIFESTAAEIYSGAPNAGTVNCHYGDIEVKSGATLKIQETYGRSLRLFGNISGAGSVQIRGNTTTQLCPVEFNGTNTFAGSLTIRDASLSCSSKYAIPSGCSVSLGYSTSYLSRLVLAAAGESNPDGFAQADLTSLFGRITKNSNGGTVFVSVPEGETFDARTIWDFSTYTAFKFGGSGEGTLLLAPPSGSYPSVAIASDDAVSGFTTLDPGNTSAPDRIGAFTVYGGNVKLSDYGYIARNADMYIGRTSCATGRLTLEGNTAIGVESGTRSVCVAYENSNNPKNGILEIGEGVVLTNVVKIGGCWRWDDVDCGAVYQRGGEVYTDDNGSNIGLFGHGYYEISGGSLVAAKYLKIPNCNNGWMEGRYGYGEMRVSGDAEVATLNNRLQIGMGIGTGVVYQTGGTITNAATTSLCSSFYTEGNVTNGLGVLTVKGAEAEFVTPGMEIANRLNGTAVMNLADGGVFATTYPGRIEKRNLQENGSKIEISGNVFFVNFDGGVFRFRGNGNPFGTAGQNTAAEVYVWEKGAVFDTQEYSGALNVPLKAPSGSGVKSITIPAGTLTGYIAPPQVFIGGDGSNATAVAEFDSTKGEVTGVIVTSPGVGYTTASAFMFRGGKGATVVPLSVTLGASSSGPLVKRGSGTLTLNCANEYAGDTVLEGGTLVAGVAGAIPSGSRIVMKGGAVSAGSGVAMPSAYVFDLSAGPVACSGAMAFPSGAQVTILHPELANPSNQGGYLLESFAGGVSGETPELANAEDFAKTGWYLKMTATKLRLVYPGGFSIFVR